jgi:hypothetical protein
MSANAIKKPIEEKALTPTIHIRFIIVAIESEYLTPRCLGKGVCSNNARCFSKRKETYGT